MLCSVQCMSGFFNGTNSYYCIPIHIFFTLCLEIVSSLSILGGLEHTLLVDFRSLGDGVVCQEYSAQRIFILKGTENVSNVGLHVEENYAQTDNSNSCLLIKS